MPINKQLILVLHHLRECDGLGITAKVALLALNYLLHPFRKVAR